MKHFTEIKIETDKFKIVFCSNDGLWMNYVQFPVHSLSGAIKYSIDMRNVDIPKIGYPEYNPD